MKLYKLTVRKGLASGTFSRYAHSPEEAIAGWLEDNPTTQVVSCTLTEREITQNGLSTCQMCVYKERSSSQHRTHHKARITQMRNNTQSLMEDEEAILTLEERVQLSRVACQLDRILALWSERTMELKLNRLLN